MKVQINDGGRAKYFAAPRVADCVVRAVAIATERDYKEVYDEIKKLVGYTPRNGIRHKDTKKIMNHFGGRWTATMGIGTGCRVHLKDGEMPMRGRYICNLSGHVTAVIDGVIHDTFDPSRDGKRCVYGYWFFPRSIDEAFQAQKRRDAESEKRVLDIFRKNECHYDVCVSNGYIEILVLCGDWKHDHLFLDHIMKQNGFALIDEVIEEEDGSDCYSSTHRFKEVLL